MGRLVMTLAGCALMLFASGCTKQQPGGAAKAGEKGKLYIFNWTYYMPDEVRTGFEKEFNAQIVYDMYASNEEMFTKLKAGGGGYDLVFPSGDYVSIMIHEGMLDTIDKAGVPNFSLIDSMVLGKIRFDPGCRYSVPYMMASSGIAVNRTMVKDYPRSWKIFGTAALKGRMTMLDDMREVMGAALKSLGYSVNTGDTSQLNQARDVVLGWKKNLQKFDAESFAKSFSAGEFHVVHGYAENVFREYDSTKRGDVDFFIPPEGGPMYIDNMCILKGARNRELAHAFINYIHRPDVYAKICDFLMLPSSNVKAREFMKVKPNYQIEDMRNGELKEDLGKNLELYDRIWQEIRIGN